MERIELTWSSGALGREATLVRWGWYGKPVLLFPTSSGGPDEVESFGLVKALAPLVDAGRVKVYSIGCPEASVWMDRSADGGERSAAMASFDQHVLEEVAPRILEDCEAPADLRITAAGANVGAFSAVNAVAKHPERFDIAVGMSGMYDFDRWMGSHFDSDYYFNQPLRFLPNLEGATLSQVQKGLFVLATGTGRWEEPDQTRRLASVLQAKRIPNSTEVWGPDADHDWPTWRTMLPLFLGRVL
ncbi:MAG: alpha/beta hydrolase-fold protein [Myxococcota bacterium]